MDPARWQMLIMVMSEQGEDALAFIVVKNVCSKIFPKKMPYRRFYASSCPTEKVIADINFFATQIQHTFLPIQWSSN